MLAAFRCCCLGERPREVGDRPLGVLDLVGGTVVADRALTDSAVELPSGGETPGAPGSGVEISLEVVRGPGLVAAEHDVDRLVGQFHAQVLQRDRAVVPHVDLAVENLGRGQTVEVQRRHTVDVERDGDRADDHGQVPGGRTAPLLSPVVLVARQNRIRAAEIVLIVQKFVDPGAGIIGRVVQRLSWARVREGLDELGHRVLLGRGPAGFEVRLASAGHFHRRRTRAGAAARGVVVTSACRQDQHAGHEHAQCGAKSVELQSNSFRRSAEIIAPAICTPHCCVARTHEAW